MSVGKMISQAGHAFLGAFLQTKNLEILNLYHIDFPEKPGTKICLRIESLDQLLLVEQQVKEAGLSFFRVVDSGCKNFFDGNPTITALGIGPVTKDKIKHITSRFKLI